MKLADHPTSRLTAFPQLHSARRAGGKVYFGYGDWNNFPACVLVSYDPARNVLALEHSVASDAVDAIREIDGLIYLPHVDPIHYEDFHDYSWRGEDGRWLQSVSLEMLHVFDFSKLGSQLVCASSAGLHVSLNEGRTWKLAVSSSQRQYWCFEYKGAVYSVDGKYADGLQKPVSNSPAYWNHSTLFHDTTADTDLMLGLSGKAPANTTTSGSLSSFNGTTWRSLKSGVKDFTTWGPDVFTLLTNSIQTTANPAANPVSFSAVPVSGVPSTATCMELLDGRFYIGTSKGEIWVANADGTPVTVEPPAVEVRIPDSFGRGLALDGDNLMVGAPDASASTFLEGKAEWWSHGDGQWRPQQSVSSPVPDFSGWFGRDVALHGDLMAVVEAGHDKSNKDRGTDAKVHVYQLADGAWTPRAVLEIPFAQSVAIQDDMLVVGTSNRAEDQAPGWPGWNPYTITRDDAHLAVLTALPQVLAYSSSSSYGYKSLVRVALMDDLLIVGYSGDPSRTAVGAVEIYRREGAGFYRTPVKRFLESYYSKRFGFGLAAHAGKIAVGAPFEDTGATNAGAVFIYESVLDPEGTTSIVQKQVLRAPSVQAHGEFGAAVAVHGDLLLVGSPGREVDGVRQRGAVYKYRRQVSGEWTYAGEIAPPSDSITEFGIEVACNDRWMAAGSLACAAGASGLTSRVRMIPCSGYEEWLDAQLITKGREPAADTDGDGLSTLLEYTTNLEPGQPGRAGAAMKPGAAEPSGLPVLSEGNSEGMRALTFVRPRNDPRVSTTVETSADLVKWEPVSDLPEVLAAGTTHELARFPVTATEARRWWRVKASYQAD